MRHDTYQRLLHYPTDVGNGQISVLFPDLLHAGATNTTPCLVGSRLIHAHRLISVPHLSVSRAELRPCWSVSGADINASRGFFYEAVCASSSCPACDIHRPYSFPLFSRRQRHPEHDHAVASATAHIIHAGRPRAARTLVVLPQRWSVFSLRPLELAASILTTPRPALDHIFTPFPA